MPDVSAVADANTGPAVYSKLNGGWLAAGGTSVGAPIWASYLGIVNVGMRYSGFGDLGFVNPILYDVASWAAPAVQKKSAHNAITTDGYGEPNTYMYPIYEGSNGDTTQHPGYPGYSAGGDPFFPRYCNATGIGSIYGNGLAAQFLISGTQSGTAPGSITSFTVTPGTTTARFKWTAVSSAVAYALTISHPVPATMVVANGGIHDDIYLTKGTSLEVKNMIPNEPGYSATLWAYNASGFSNAKILFSTKK